MTAEYRFVLKSLLVLPALAMVLLLSSCRKESYYVYRLVSDVEVEATDESVVNLYGGFDDPYYKDQFIKGTITWQKEPISGDWVELSHLHNGRLIYYNVPASVCQMITPEEYEAAVNEDSESPYYNKALYNFLQTHNVAQLSDGSRPAKTALAQPADLWYIFIPAGLLLLCAMICHLSGVTSLLLPLFGAFCMLMQLVVLVALSIKGMYYEDGVVLFFYTFFPALLIMAANVYSGYRINKSIIDHYNMKIGTRTILEPLGIGAAVFIALSAVSGYVYQSHPSTGLVMLCLSLAAGVVAGYWWFVRRLRAINPEAVVAAPVLAFVFCMTLILSGALLAVVLCGLFIYTIRHFFTSLNVPGGNLMGGADRGTCGTCANFNGSGCSRGENLSKGANAGECRKWTERL